MYTLSSVTAGTIAPRIGGESGPSRSANGTYTDIIIGGQDNALLEFVADPDFVGGVDDVKLYKVMPFEEGDVITGGTSGATATIRRIVVRSGDFSTDNAAGHFTITDINDTFEVDEALGFNDVVNGTFDTDTDWAKGTGWTISGGTASSDGTQAGDADLTQDISVASGATYVVTFTVSNISAGNVTAVVGDTEGTDRSANGTYTEEITAGSGTDIDIRADLDFVGDIDDVIAVRKVAEADSAQTANTIGSEGTFSFDNYAFTGSPDSFRMYGCNGKSNAFEWDGNYYTKVITGTETDTPKFVIAHKKHLFLAFPGGSLQHSSLGFPLQFRAITGAAELTTGDEITGVATEVGNVLAIGTRNNVFMLYGSSVLDWDMREFDNGAGVIEGSMQRMGVLWGYDDRGIITLAAVEAYGDFAQATVSDRIEPYLRPRQELFTASLRVRQKNQYRLYFSDNTGVYCTVKETSSPVLCRLSSSMTWFARYRGKMENGNEVLYFGSSDGYVYRLDSGNSFDDQPMDWYLRTHYHHYMAPGRIKRFRGVVFEGKSDDLVTVNVQPEFDFGDVARPTQNPEQFTMLSSAGFWDVDNWNEFYWSAPEASLSRVRLSGSGLNMGLYIYGTSQYESSHNLHGATVHFSYRRLQR